MPIPSVPVPVLSLAVAGGLLAAAAVKEPRRVVPETTLALDPIGAGPAAGAPALEADAAREGRAREAAFGPRWLPAPPAQGEPWEAPETALPAEVVSAVGRLFEHGLADPRGCRYRRIGLRARSLLRGGEEIVFSRGWVLPGGRFAVAWNGLVYPVEWVGPRARLEADVALMLRREERLRQRGGARSSRPYEAVPERDSLSHDQLLPIRVALLLRLGEGELAGRVWQTWGEGLGAGAWADRILREPYWLLVGDLAWALFDRAVLAHALGDDLVALESAEALLRLRDRGERHDLVARLGFLWQVDRLVADQRRRAGPRPPGPQDRVAALVAQLDEVAGDPWQREGLSHKDHPIVAELIAIGEVEPLAEALERDDRLTRTLVATKPWMRKRGIEGVAGPAYVALREILGHDLGGDWWTPEGRRAVAAAARARVAARD